MIKKNFAEKWQSYAKKFDTTKRSKAEAARAIGVHYNRLVGFTLGYWDLRDDELERLDAFIASNTEAE